MRTRLLLLFFISGFILSAQKTTLEKTHPVSKEDKKGYIQQIDVDEEQKEIHVIYRISEKKKSVTFHTYTFDFDFNLKGDDLETYDFESVPKDKNPASYEGEYFEIVGLHVEPNMMGTAILKRKVTKYRWSWWSLRYVINTKVEGKLKIKSENDKKYQYAAHIDFDREGTAMILAGEKDALTKDAYAHMRNFEVMKYNVDLEKLGGDKISFEFPHALVQSYPVYGDNDYGLDWVLVFAPFKEKRYTGPQQWKGDPLEYTVVRISPKAEVLERFTVQSPNSIWRIDQIWKSEQGRLVMFGPANEKQDDYFHNAMEYAEKKFQNFQVASFMDGRLEFITSTHLDEFEEKLKLAPDGKKGKAYKGKKFKANRAEIASNGDVLITGQQFNPKDGRYQDINIFHFDSKGILKAQYAMDKKYATLSLDEQHFEYSDDGQTAYWIFLDVVGEQPVKEGEMTINKPLITPKVGKLNLEKAEFEGYLEAGGGDFYAHPFVLNYLKFTDLNWVNFLGEDKKGKELWFSRMPVE